MAYPSALGKLVKSDRRREWKALKSKHSAAISASRINFDANLGPRLDKYQTVVDAVAKVFAKNALSEAAISKATELAGPVSQIADSYLDRVKTLPNPARKDLTEFLQALKDDYRNWVDAGELFRKKAVPTVTAKDLGRVHAATEMLTALEPDVTNLQVNVPLLLARLRKLPSEVSYEDFLPMSAGPKMRADRWPQYISTKLDYLTTTATAVIKACPSVDREMHLLITAGFHMGGSSDFAGYVSRISAFAKSPALTAFRKQARFLGNVAVGNDYHARALGLAQGVGLTELTRSAKSADGAANAADGLVRKVGTIFP